MNNLIKVDRRQLTAGRLVVQGFNVDQEVRQYKDVLSKRLMPYRMRRVVSPYEFYLEFTNFPEPRLYRNWFPKMQAFYENPDNREKMQLFKGIPLPGRCYICKDLRDGKWHRVRLHSVKKPSNNLIVFYLDLCKLQSTKAENLLELYPQFALAPAQVFRCYLADVSPLGTKGDTVWSEEACQYFQNIVKDKEFIGITLTRSDELVTSQMPDFVTNLGVVLVESQAGRRSPKPEVCTLNAQMVDAGFAAATGVCAGCKHAIEFEKNLVPIFDQREFDHLFPEDPQPSTSSQPPELTKNGTMTASEVARIEVAERQNAAAHYKNTTNYLPEEIGSQLAGIKVVYVVKPSHIIVHLKSKLPELNKMQEGIQKLVEKKEPLVNGKPGMFVACTMLDLVNGKIEKTIWCRGVISKVVKRENTEMYRILLVDYGNAPEVESDFVRELPSYFEKIPSFAVRIHLDVENLIPVVVPEIYNAAVSSDFRKYLLQWTDKEPIYFLYHPKHAEKFELNHYAQLILYSREKKKWYIDPEEKASSSYRFLNKLRDHPMVHNLFISVGVELKYEVFTPDSPFWHFISISNILEDKGHAKTGQRNKTTTRLHCDIVDAASSNNVEFIPMGKGSSRLGAFGGNYSNGLKMS